MSIHDTPRTYADPREVVARALCNRIRPKPLNGGDAWDVLQSWCVAEEAGSVRRYGSAKERDEFLADAGAVLKTLLTHGFLSEHYFDAMKARNGK